MATPIFSSSSTIVASPTTAKLPAKFAVASFSSSNSLFFTSGGARPAAALVSGYRRRYRSERPSAGALGARCLFGLGVPELVVIGGVAALLFGPKQLPAIGRSFGKTLKSFHQAAKEFESELTKTPTNSEESVPVEDSTDSIIMETKAEL